MFTNTRVKRKVSLLVHVCVWSRDPWPTLPLRLILSQEKAAGARPNLVEGWWVFEVREFTHTCTAHFIVVKRVCDYSAFFCVFVCHWVLTTWLIPETLDWRIVTASPIEGLEELLLLATVVARKARDCMAASELT